MLNNPLEDTDILDEEGPDETKFPLGFLDELNTTLPVTTDPLESILDLEKSTSSMDNPFFEEFMDLDQLFPELSSVEFGFEVEQASPVLTSDICQSDVVTVDTGECPYASAGLYKLPRRAHTFDCAIEKSTGVENVRKSTDGKLVVSGLPEWK